MFRKDVRIGFAIGGVLLAVLIVYVLVISAGDQRTPEQVTLVTPDNPVAPPSQPAQADPPAPVAPRDPFAGATSQPSGGDRWSMALTTGQLPVMMTETPARPAPPVPADANKPAVETLTNLPAVASNVPAVVRDASATSRPDALSSSQTRTHVVAADETFSSIAASVYGSSSYYPQLMNANPSIEPRKLRPGMVINVPPISQPKTDAPAAVSDSAPVRVDARTEYRVESGDSLYRISTRLYAKPDRADKIYDLNKAAIGPDPSRLKVGMVLQLPEPPTTAR